MSIVILTPTEIGHIQIFKGNDPNHYRRIRISDRCITASCGIDKDQPAGTNDVFVNFTSEEWELFKKSVKLSDDL